MSLSAVDEGADALYCVNHPDRETYVRCGKCERPICTRCMVQTPVGARCRECAQLRRLPQHEVAPALLARALPAGFAASFGIWYILDFVPAYGLFAMFIAAFLAGTAVGTIVSRLANRRSNRVLEAGTAACIIGGWLVVQLINPSGGADVWTRAAQRPGYLLVSILPVLLTCYIAITRIR